VNKFGSQYGPPAVSSQQDNRSCGLHKMWDFLIAWTFRNG